jgi:hypothetical protein
MLACAGPGLAAQLTKTVRYHGVSLRVPAAWPVFQLGADPSTCVRFNRHAVYLGRPGTNQSCPGLAVGRTEAILVSPASYRGALLAPVTGSRTQAASMARIDDSRHHVVITATWDRHPSLIRTALELRSLRAAVRATTPRRPVGAPMSLRHGSALARVTSPESPATPGEVYAGLGFDVCTTPSTSAMSAWGAKSPYAAIGIYIGGTNAACLGGNLSASWVQAESVAGWHMIPIYVGLQAPLVSKKPSSGCGGCAAMSASVTTAATQGAAAAQDAVAQAQALGIGTANPIYYDMENYTRSLTASAAVLAFLQAWTVQLHTSGYLSGVYSSGSSGITDLVDNYGTSYVEPDELWTADWDSSAPKTAPASTANPYVPATDWPSNHQLLQYYADSESGKSESYGGVAIGIDRDYVDAPTAAYGAGTLVSLVGSTPTLKVRPQADGSVKLTPHWAGEAGIAAYTILAGKSSAAGMTAVESVAANTKFPVKLRAVHRYYEVQGLNSLGQVVGTSAPTQTPASVAAFGHSAYVGAKGPVGIPVACLNLRPCQLAAQIFDGKRRVAHSDLVGVAAHGGQLLVPMSAQTHRLVTDSPGHELPVTVTLTSASGAKVSRPLQLVGYTISGTSPRRRTWPSSVLQILASTSYVSNAWTGGVLAVCRASVPCVSTVHVTLAGAALAAPRTTTLGPGEIGYLTYGLDNHGHKLLRAELGNQLGARLTVTTAVPSTTTPAPTGTPPPASSGSSSGSGGGGLGTAAAATSTKTTMALISLVSFR